MSELILNWIKLAVKTKKIYIYIEAHKPATATIVPFFTNTITNTVIFSNYC
jgi:hypothetical protein